MPPRKKKSDLFFNTFIGEEVQIFCKTKIKTIVQNESEVRESEEPVMFQGFLLDVDDDFYFIGSTPNEVCSAIKKDELGSIHIANGYSIYDQVLDEMAEPVDDKDIN